MKLSTSNALSLSFLLANAATLVKAKECVTLGQFDLKKVSGSDFNGEFISVTPAPFSTAGSTVCGIRLKANCVSNGLRTAPTCSWEIDLSFNKGEPCDPSRASHRSGKIFANGTGPAAYHIANGQGSFVGATGKIDSVFNRNGFNNRPALEGFGTVGQICYDENVPVADGCCSWDGSTCAYGGASWCDVSEDRCEDSCDGMYIDPANPPVPAGCCTWNGSTCEPDNWCNFSKDRCEGPCGGRYI